MENPFKNTIAVMLSQHRFGITRKVKPEEARAVSQATGETCNENAVSLAKRLLKSPQYDAIMRLDAGIRTRLHELSVPSVLRDGVVLVSLDFFERVREELRIYQRTRESMVAAFCSSYSDAVAEARETLGSLFDSSQYPPVDYVRGRFSVEVQYVGFDVSEGLKSIDENLYQREKEKLQECMAEAAREIRLGMRAALADLVGHLGQVLSGEREGGKPKILRDSAVNNISDWLDLFEGRNVTGDQELARMVEQCRSLINGIGSPENLRTSAGLRQEVAFKTARIKEALDDLVTELPARRMSLEDDAA